jgi:hypothetical protein
MLTNMASALLTKSRAEDSGGALRSCRDAFGREPLQFGYWAARDHLPKNSCASARCDGLGHSRSPSPRSGGGTWSRRCRSSGRRRGRTCPRSGRALVDVTDGDTPNLRMPVRMLSVDTPEVTARTEERASAIDQEFLQLAEWIREGLAPI